MVATDFLGVQAKFSFISTQIALYKWVIGRILIITQLNRI